MNKNAISMILLIALVSTVSAEEMGHTKFVFVEPDYSIPGMTYIGSAEKDDVCNLAAGMCIGTGTVALVYSSGLILIPCIVAETSCFLATAAEAYYPGCEMFVVDYWDFFGHLEGVPRCSSQGEQYCPTLGDVVTAISLWESDQLSLESVLSVINLWADCNDY